MGQSTKVLVQHRPGLLPTIRHFENRRGEGPGDEVVTELAMFISGFAVRENASFGRSDDVTILLFRSKIAKNKPKENMTLRKA